jgi:hypothetical protein
MKTLWLPALLVVLAAGCVPAPSGNGPVSNTSSSDLSISIPSADTTLVSLSIPGMT